jgi:hypothetical protein
VFGELLHIRHRHLSNIQTGTQPIAHLQPAYAQIVFAGTGFLDQTMRHQRPEDAVRAGRMQAGLVGQPRQVDRSGRPRQHANQRHGAVDDLN